MKKIYAAALMLAGAFAASASLPQIDFADAGIRPEKTPLKVSAKAAANASGIITTAPEGKKCLYLRNGKNYAMFGTLFPMPGIVENAISEFIYTDDGEVYIKNIVSSFPTGSYVKGKVEEGKITLELPQIIAVANIDGVTTKCYVDRASKKMSTGQDSEYAAATDRTMRFDIGEDGSIAMEPTNDGQTLLAVMDADGKWLGYGDWEASFTLFDEGDGPLTMPENLETTDFLFIADGLSHFVKVAFDNNDVYMQGIFATFPEGCIKGTLTEDNKITFKSGQYLGYVDDGSSAPLYFVGAKITTTSNGQRTQYDIIDEATFDYNPETKTMKSQNALLANASLTKVKYNEYFREPVVRINGENYDPKPMDPYYVAYSPWNEYDLWCGIQFRLPNMTPEMNYLDLNNISWRMFINGKKMLFDPEHYEQFTEPAEWIPFNADSMEIQNAGTALHTVILFDPEIQTIGVQSRYQEKGNDAFYSNIIQYDINTGEITVLDPSTGVEAATTENARVLTTDYYGIDGIKVQNPENGIYLKRSVMSDGTIRNSKVIVK